MFLGVVASTGETIPPIWFKSGFCLGAEEYVKVLKKTLIPWMRLVAKSHAIAGVPAAFTLQQDLAPAHRTKRMLDFLKEEEIAFWSPQQWPPNSPDLNPLDYAIWSMVAQGACAVRPKSITALKRRVSAYWRTGMEAAKIRAVCRRFRPRLERCVAENGSFLY